MVDDALRQGVFCAGLGRSGFLAHVWSKQRLRFDPVVMNSRDSLAYRACEFFDACAASTVEYLSPRPGTTLFIDTRWTFHGHASVPDGVGREVDRAHD